MGGNGAERRGKTKVCGLALQLMSIGVLVAVLSMLINPIFYTITGPPTGKFAFVFGAERAPQVVEALNSSRVFSAVLRVDDSQALRRLCDNLERFVHTPYPERIRDGCANKSVVVVTDGKLAAAVVFLGSGDEVTQQVVEALTFERFEDGNIDIYDADKQLGYAKGYELRRLFTVFYWEPIGVGSTINAVVRRYEAEIVAGKKVLDTVSGYMLFAGIAVLLPAVSLLIFKCMPEHKQG